ncbi:MAG: hypothetical protein ABIS69_10425 [Sediminibacterium sp.]
MRRLLPISLCLLLLLNSCSLLRKLGIGKEKSGCPIGNNIGAEKILSNDPQALKAAKKANKKGNKVFFN